MTSQLSSDQSQSCHQHNLGCMGGLMDNAFKYVIANHGIDTEASYPYNATTGKTCKFNQTAIGATISSFKDIPRNSEMVNSEIGD